MKILIPTIEYPPIIGGISSYILNLVKHWPNPDEFFVLCPKLCRKNINFTDNEHITILRRKVLLKYFWPKWIILIYHIFKISKKEKIDKLIIHHVLPIGYVALLNKKINNIPFDICLHGLDFNNALKKKKKLNIVLKFANKIIVNSNFLAKQVKKEFPIFEDKVVIVYPCSSLRHKADSEEKINEIQEWLNPNKRPLILTTGRLTERKGHDMVIKSLLEVKKEIPDILYLICGEGDYEWQLQKMIYKNDLEKNVTMIDFVKKKELPYIYSIADVFIMPNRKLGENDVEGFGIVYLEAAECGLPVIAGNQGGVKEAVLDGQTGLLIDPTNVNEIAKNIVKLLKNKELANRLGQAGKKRAEENFTWTTQLKKMFH